MVFDPFCKGWELVVFTLRWLCVSLFLAFSSLHNFPLNHRLCNFGWKPNHLSGRHQILGLFLMTLRQPRRLPHNSRLLALLLALNNDPLRWPNIQTLPRHPHGTFDLPRSLITSFTDKLIYAEHLLLKNRKLFVLQLVLLVFLKQLLLVQHQRQSHFLQHSFCLKHIVVNYLFYAWSFFLLFFKHFRDEILEL